jgi:DNA-binding transcriptional regulator PaaX
MSEKQIQKKQLQRTQLKKKLQTLPVNMGIAGLALLFGLAERGVAAVSEVLETGGHSLGRSYGAMTGLRNFWDYYDELKNLKENSARTILWRLQKKGLVKKTEKYYQLTFQGLKIVKNFKTDNSAKTVWDGRWRMIMFDIPEKKRKERDWLRYQLLCLDYQSVQKSVFIGRQPIEEDVWNDIVERDLNKCIRLITVGEIDDDEILFNFLND